MYLKAIILGNKDAVVYLLAGENDNLSTDEGNGPFQTKPHVSSSTRPGTATKWLARNLDPYTENVQSPVSPTTTPSYQETCSVFPKILL